MDRHSLFTTTIGVNSVSPEVEDDEAMSLALERWDPFQNLKVYA